MFALFVKSCQSLLFGRAHPAAIKRILSQTSPQLLHLFARVFYLDHLFPCPCFSPSHHHCVREFLRLRRVNFHESLHLGSPFIAMVVHAFKMEER